MTQENTDCSNIADAIDSLAHVGSGSIRIKKFRNTYDTHGGALYNYLLWMTKDAETSRDILQTVFIRLWEAKSLPEHEDALRRWLFTTARNAFFDSYRSHCRFSRLREHYNREYFPDPPEAPDGFFWTMLSECSDSERSILYLHLKAGYSYNEIGVILNLSESNVRVKTCRAIKRLRELNLRRKSYEG